MTSPDLTLLITHCPHCHKKSAWHNNPHRPFCSERCKLIDLGAWASEEYKIPQPAVSSELSDDANY